MDLKLSIHFIMMTGIPCSVAMVTDMVAIKIYGKMYSQKVIFFHPHLHDRTNLPNYKDNSEDMLLAELSSSYKSCIHLLWI